MVTLVSPQSGLPLQEAGNELIDGAGGRFPIVAGIPRICELDNYTQNFGLQWNEFDVTQLDRPETGLEFSSARFFAETAWSPEDLADKDVLEVGSGAGRFTQVILAKTRARLWSVDYSSAVELGRVECVPLQSEVLRVIVRFADPRDARDDRIAAADPIDQFVPGFPQGKTGLGTDQGYHARRLAICAGPERNGVIETQWREELARTRRESSTLLTTG